MNTPLRAPRRVQHTLRRRLLQVSRVRDLSPRMRRITLAGDELEGFVSLGPDDHVKLFFPPGGQDGPAIPDPAAPEGPPPAARDYTPRCYDPVMRELDIDFVLHGDGPAASWAARAAPGHWIAVGGPRGSMLLEHDYGAYLLIGDETALPAIARHLEEIRPGAKVRAIIEIAGPEEEIALPTEAQARITWLHRNGLPAGTPALLSGALSTLPLSRSHDLYDFIAGEIETARLLRRHLVDGVGLPRGQVRAAGYWRLGEAGAHARLDD